MASAPLLRGEETKAGELGTITDVVSPMLGSSSKERIEQVFASQAGTALKLRTSTAKERIVKIKKLQEVLLKNRDALYEAAYADFKKPQGEVDLAEITPVMLEVGPTHFACTIYLHTYVKTHTAAHNLWRSQGPIHFPRSPRSHP